ncbi:hypothetical protein FOCG_09001 [Fusarium oxysporum f. sp. radicis-lycopersici 26381]|uniref:Uncharacterized protein n=1 Tax=Fusarium oxysporum Fo47 TaxID=660027 RepID=W9K4G1_FUSOX|nr:hypothetical protein FOZG_08408 [Fusarium oxysporum Fo47]EXL50816.1 hypothetical protein FOCG_09001 [Fusarium oxysporum f. sp. radicis-lycopersici 26381]
MLGSGSSTHHCPVCHTTARTRCVKQEHLEVCRNCGDAWSLKHHSSCPYCRGKDEAEEARNERERKAAEKKKKKKSKWNK